jgi:hypothetical protein
MTIGFGGGARGGAAAEARLTERPSGELVRAVAVQLAELPGQFTLLLQPDAAHKSRSIDDVVADTEEAEDRGDHEPPGRHGAEGDRALPAQDPAGAPAGRVILFMLFRTARLQRAQG